MSIFSFFNRPDKSTKPGDTPDVPAADSDSSNPVELVMHGLAKLQARVTRHEQVNNIMEIDFEFQAGHFMAQVSESLGSMSLCYPSIGGWGLKELAAIEYLCNRMSSQMFGTHLTYRIIKSDDSVGIAVDIWANLFVSEVPAMDVVIERLIRIIFTVQRDFCKQLDDYDPALLEETPDNSLNRTVFKQLYLKEIVKSWEKEQVSSAPAVDAPLERPTVGNLLDTVIGQPQGTVTFISLDIITTETVKRLAQGPEAGDVMLSTLLVDQLTAIGRFSIEGESAPRVVTVTVNKSPDNILNDNPAGQSFFVTFSLQPVNPTLDPTINGSFNSGRQLTLIVGPDSMNPAANDAEIRFMKADALDKIREGRHDELTVAQKLMAALDRPVLDENLYNGLKEFYNGNFLLAARLLDPVARTMLASVYKMDEDGRRSLHLLLFYTGVSYMKIGNFDSSFFFLEPLMHYTNIDWTKAVLTTLMSTHDFRTRAFIESLLDSVSRFERDMSQHDDGDDDNNEQADVVREFKEYLNFTLANFYVTDGMIEEAETLLRPLIGGLYNDEAQRLLDKIVEMKNDVDRSHQQSARESGEEEQS